MSRTTASVAFMVLLLMVLGEWQQVGSARSRRSHHWISGATTMLAMLDACAVHDIVR
jgi:hypothetical protein